MKAAERIREAVEAGEEVRLTGFGFDANLGGNTLIFRIGEDEVVETAALYLDSDFVNDMDLSEEER